MKKLFFCIIASVMCLSNANAEPPCPGGFFCINNGLYLPYSGGIKQSQKAPADLVTSSWGDWSEEGFCSSCKKSRSGCSYCADDYDEAWVSTWFGFYLVKNDDVIYHSSGNTPARGAFPCPGTYPSSDQGASSVFECYKIVNGQKEYYKAPTNTQTSSSVYMDENGNVVNENRNYNIDVGTVNALVKDLQSALSKAQALQEVLSKSNQKNSTTSAGSSNADINAMKAMINAGITDNKVISDKQIKKVRK